jgi:uncharacterized protein (UPF0276 family)
MIPIGFTLQPEEEYLELLDELIRTEVDYYEVAPETLWRPRVEPSTTGARDPEQDWELVPNGFHARFVALRGETRKSFVAHGVGFSVGSARPDPERRARWLARMRADQALFDFEWYTDHLGASEIAGRELVLPLPLPMTEAAADAVRASLRAMQSAVPDVGVENSVFYYHLGRPLDEPRFLASILRAPRTHLLLDLHNVFTTAMNAGFEPWNYVERLPLERVIEIHLSGGSESEAAWLPSRRTLRLDSHDAAVPEEVWALLERVLPLVPNLRGLTLERMEGTVGESDVPLLHEELRRARRIAEGVHAR